MGHRADVNPGESAQQPPAAVLKKLRLKPGAIYELTTPVGLAWHLPEDKSRPTSFTKTDPATRLEGVAGVVTVTWHLHTTNGTEWSKDLKSRHWPARGGWSGVLSTAPQRVQLRDEAVRRK